MGLKLMRQLPPIHPDKLRARFNHTLLASAAHPLTAMAVVIGRAVPS